MTAVNVSRSGEADVYEAVDQVNGGQLVVAKAGATQPGKQGITPAGDGSRVVLGVAARRATPVALQVQNATDGDGYDNLIINPVNELTTVYKQKVVNVTYTAAAVTFGTKLAAAASGAVRAFVAGTDAADAVVGECRVVGGVGAAGGVGYALIY